jgi:CPA1 family monovalent cation:H+ antiporter
VSGGAVSAPTLVLRFVLGVVGAVAIGVVVAFVARWITARVTDTTGRSALTLVLPFAVYVAADEIGASGVVAVVVLALQLRSASGADEAAERLVQRSFWDVVELLVTGVAFGLMGLDLRQVAEAAADDLPRMLRDAAVICAVVIAVRVLWMLAAWWMACRSDDPERSPRTGRETVVLSWCGMRGLATLALALSLPTVTASGEPFPQRAEIVLIAVVVLVFTLVIPGFTLPFLVRRLGVATDADTEHAAEQAIVLRARAAATAVLDDRVDRLPVGVGTSLRQRMDRLDGLLRGDPMSTEDRERAETVRRYREVMASVQAEALAAARAEVLAARREPGVDPEAADRVLRRLDLRTVLLD